MRDRVFVVACIGLSGDICDNSIISRLLCSDHVGIGIEGNHLALVLNVAPWPTCLFALPRWLSDEDGLLGRTWCGCAWP